MNTAQGAPPQIVQQLSAEIQRRRRRHRLSIALFTLFRTGLEALCNYS